MQPNYAPFIRPTGGFGQTVTPAQQAVLRTLTLLGAMGAGALLGQMLGGKEWAITGGVVGPVAAIMMMARAASAGA